MRTREGNEIADKNCSLRQWLRNAHNCKCANCVHVLDLCAGIKKEKIQTHDGYNKVIECAGFVRLTPLLCGRRAATVRVRNEMTNDTNALLETISPEEAAAAVSFCETCDDDEGYMVPKAMMKRLTVLGLVIHKGFGYYEQTMLLLDARDALERMVSNACNSGCRD